MPAITVKNIPPELYEKFKELAKANRRSINSEVLLCMEQAVEGRPRDAEEIIARARQVRELTARYLISDEELTQAKREGRL